ncbi:hypothetical protein [Belnapia moabensis]|uniref:hypothetical protein n=1 Tax=Belnapia moabensis TaxID=365533 RepID=UPI0012ECD957|nr:hypothetical protein [Belnapia moabensis]
MDRFAKWHALATRREKTARSFLGALYLAATTAWIKFTKREQALGANQPTGPRLQEYFGVVGAQDIVMPYPKIKTSKLSVEAVNLQVFNNKPVCRT